MPFKGQVLNLTSAWWFEKTRHIIDNHLDELAGLFDPPGPVVPRPAPMAPAGDGADVPSVTTRDHRSPGVLPVVLASRTAASASAVAAVSARAAAGVPAPDLARAVQAPRQVAGAVLDAVKSVGDQVSAAVQNPAGGAGKALARARGAAAGR